MSTWRFVVNLAYADGGGPGVNVWHLRNTGEPFDNDVQECVDAIRAFYARCANGATAGASCFQKGMVISAEQVVNVASDEASNVDFLTLTVPDNGPSAAPVLALCVTWRTSVAARRGRGRTFLGPLAGLAVQDNGTPNEDFRSVVQTACDELAAFNDGFDNGAVGIYGRTAAGSGDHVLRDITAGSVPNEFAVMRSRRD